MHLITAKKLAFVLLSQERLLEKGWRCVFDDAQTRLGFCDTEQKLITLSRYFIALNSEETTVDLIRHEVAHALAPDDDRHGEKWQAEARRLGASLKACAGVETVDSSGDLIRRYAG